MLSGICFGVVNTILTIILLKTEKIDGYFMGALFFTMLGNALLSGSDAISIYNFILSWLNFLIGFLRWC